MATRSKKAGATPAPKNRRMTPAQRRAVSERMKKHWRKMRRLGTTSLKARRVKGPETVGDPQPVDVKINWRVASDGFDPKAMSTGVVTKGLLGSVDTEVPPVIPGHVEARLKEDASADQKVGTILKGSALTDLRAARAAQFAYSGKGNVVIMATTPAEERILDQLADNLLRCERAAILDLIVQWGRALDVDEPKIFALRQLLQRVRGRADRDIKDQLAVGQYVDEDDFLPFRATSPVKWSPTGKAAGYVALAE